MADTSEAVQAIEDMKQRLSAASELDTLATQIDSLKKSAGAVGDLSPMAEQLAKLKEGLKLVDQAKELRDRQGVPAQPCYPRGIDAGT